MERKQRHIAELDKQKNELLDLRLEGLLSSNELRKRMQRLHRRRGELEADISNIKRRLASIDRKAQWTEDIEQFCRRLAERVDTLSFEEKRELIRILDIRVTIHKDRRIVIEWPFEVPVCVDMSNLDNYTHTVESREAFGDIHFYFYQVTFGS
ncbi:hypothetical protein [Calderihabitans maritimus]|uniref:Uncharacterized protein n=1 Tax=Calderihabitans maritimus TaxID=1246530 RepID=A0A1Z5HXT1_9FIRM|nr:hypothetical protein [Calderihabitans maritimus]GAW94339.1 hypothetical protein KKC1_34470 [Calderihabitans maritimus]